MPLKLVFQQQQQKKIYKKGELEVKQLFHSPNPHFFIEHNLWTNFR